MAQRYYSSTAQQMSLVAAVDDTVTTIQVDTVTGLPVQTPFTVVIDVGQASEEIVTVTGVAGTILTVIRGEDGTAAASHAIGATVRHMMTPRDLREPQQHMDATTGVHGLEAGSSFVGTAQPQTLTNKAIDGSQNTLSNIPQSAVTNLTTDLAALGGALDTLATEVDANATTAADATAAVAANLSTHTTATAAHGATGAVVGTTNAQTLTNKTLDAPVITSPPANVANPVGAVQLWAGGSTPPTGWLVCDGSAVSRSTYAALFSVIGTTFGVGNGSTTFNLPNLKGRVPVGLDSAQTEFDTLGETGGAKTVTLTKAQMPAHNHALTVGGSPAVGATASNATAAGGSFFSASGGVSQIVMGEAGGNEAHPNLQPYIVLRYIIKF